MERRDARNILEALLFITLVFPIQFERQWITLGWALEGTALLWLFRRVPHPSGWCRCSTICSSPARPQPSLPSAR